MRGKVNLDYKISDVPFMRHRALYLYNPAVDMTGDYTCKVSTLKNEAAMTKKMVVYGEDLLQAERESEKRNRPRSGTIKKFCCGSVIKKLKKWGTANAFVNA